MTQTTDRVTVLLAAVANTPRLPDQTWLKDALAATFVDEAPMAARRALQLQRAFPELAYSDEVFNKLWRLYETLTMFANDLRPSRDIGFVHFLLGLKKSLRSGKPLEGSEARHAEWEGERIEKQVMGT